MANALFVCLHNAGRSQMSQALFERAADGRHEGRSAGTTPGDRVHPEVVEVMIELGIDLADRKPKLLSTEDAEWADVVVTMGCGDKCPYVPGVRYVDWDLPDPKDQPVETVRATRDEIADAGRGAGRRTRPRLAPRNRDEAAGSSLSSGPTKAARRRPRRLHVPPSPLPTPIWNVDRSHSPDGPGPSHRILAAVASAANPGVS